jgi:leucyl-tRNA synthetase
MKMLNALEGAFAADAQLNPADASILRESVSILLRTLYPVTPHICCAAWTDLGFDLGFEGTLLDAPWPVHDESALVTDEIELVVQVNGKMRGQMTVASSASKEAIEAQARTSELVAKYTNGAEIKKVIVVPGKLVNVVA